MKSVIVFLSALLCCQAFAQTITVYGTQTVPEGKKWRFVAGREYAIRIIEGSQGCIYEGEYGGGRVAIIPGIEKIEPGNRRVYSIFLRRDMMKKQQGVDGMYLITSIGIVEGAISRESNLLDTRNLGNIFFTAGQRVSLTGCLMSITMEEVDDVGILAEQTPRVPPPPPPDTKKKAEASTSTGTVYRVQVLASSSPSAEGRIRREYGITEDIHVEQFGAVYRYLVGNCSTREEAEALRLRLAERGLKDALIRP